MSDPQAASRMPDIDPGAQLKKILRGAREKRFLLLMLAAVGLILGAFIATLVPDLFESKTLLLVRERQLVDNSNLIKAIEDKSLAQKEQTLAQELRSFVWVKEVLEMVQWPEYLEKRGDPADVSEFVDKVRDPKYFEVEMDTDQAGELLMKIVFRWFEPEAAAQFVRSTRQHWIESRDQDNLRYHRRQLQELSDQKNEAELAHARAKQALELFQQTHKVFDVYSTEDSDVKQKDRLAIDLNTMEGEIHGLTERVSGLEAELAKQQPQTTQVETQINTQFLVAQNAVNLAQGELQALLVTKSENHPAVQKAREKLEQASLGLAAVQGQASLPGATTTQPNPEYERLRGEIARLKAELRGRERTRSAMKELLDEITERLERRPVLDNELRTLKNEYEVTLATLNDFRVALVPLELKVKALEGGGGLFRDAEAALRDAGAYEILEEPVVPNKPAGLPKILFSLIGLIVFLAGGLAGVTVWQMTRTTLDTVDDVQKAFALPILGAVGRIATRAEVRRARVAALTSTLGSLLLVGSLGYVVYLVTTAPERLPAPFQERLEVLKDTFR